jgi:hypothetical protein
MRRVEGTYVTVPCGLPTTHKCNVCEQPVCRWHKVANHEHVLKVHRRRVGQ